MVFFAVDVFNCISTVWPARDLMHSPLRGNACQQSCAQIHVHHDFRNECAPRSECIDTRAAHLLCSPLEYRLVSGQYRGPCSTICRSPVTIIKTILIILMSNLIKMLRLPQKRTYLDRIHDERFKSWVEKKLLRVQVDRRLCSSSATQMPIWIEKSPKIRT